MGTYRALLVGLILAAASAQQPSSPSVPFAPTYKLQGRVVTPSGEWMQINGPDIVDSMEKVLFVGSFDARTGAFAFPPLPAGTYTVRVSGMSRQNQTIFTRHKVVLGNDLTDVELVLSPGMSIPVKVRKESAHPLGPCWWDPLAEKLQLADCSDYRAARVTLVPVDSARLPYISGAGVVKDPINFTMDGIEPGKYVVRVELPTYPSNYVQSVRSGNLDLLHEELSVPEYGSVLPIEILLRDDFASIKVHTRVEAVRPVIVLLSEGLLLPAPRLASLDEAGSSFALAPGSYAVFAFDSPKGWVYSDLEFLSKYAARAVKVTVSANETRSVNLDVIHIEE